MTPWRIRSNGTADARQAGPGARDAAHTALIRRRSISAKLAGMLRRHDAGGPSAALPTNNTIRLACADCSLRAHCLPPELSTADFEQIEATVSSNRRVARGAHLFYAGQKFDALYAIKSGFFKTTLTLADGRQQITGFRMSGEIIGMHGIAGGHYINDAVALEDSVACRLPYARIQELARSVPALQAHLHNIMSREIAGQHGTMLLLGNMRAEERVAAFLINLLQRLDARGYSGTELQLRMTREEIGSYLGLKLETVSRIFSRFAADELLEVSNRHVRVLDMDALQARVHLPGCTQ